MAMSLRTLGHQGPLLTHGVSQDGGFLLFRWWKQGLYNSFYLSMFPVWEGGAGESLGGEEHGFPSQTRCESYLLSADLGPLPNLCPVSLIIYRREIIIMARTSYRGCED